MSGGSTLGMPINCQNCGAGLEALVKEVEASAVQAARISEFAEACHYFAVANFRLSELAKGASEISTDTLLIHFDDIRYNLPSIFSGQRSLVRCSSLGCLTDDCEYWHKECKAGTLVSLGDSLTQAEAARRRHRAAYMRRWRKSKEWRRRQLAKADNRDLFHVVGLTLSPQSSLKLWERPGVFIKVVPAGWHVGWFGANEKNVTRWE